MGHPIRREPVARRAGRVPAYPAESSPIAGNTMSFEHAHKAARPVIRRSATLAAILTALAVSSAGAQQGNGYSAPLHANVSADGATQVRVENGSGHLVINGKNGASQVSATATVRGSSQRAVDAVRLIARREGDVIVVRADRPDNNWFRDDNVSIDLTVEVPTSLGLEVNNGSGGAQIDNVGALAVRAGSGGVQVSNVQGTAEMNSGSGGARLRNVHGDVTVSTGSGGITIAGVTGSVDVRSAGSGSVNVSDVSGSLHLGSIGSGSVDADRIGGDLTVDRKGSGSVSYTNVKGHVSVPRRGRDW
jgi:hypothetical protein